MPNTTGPGTNFSAGAWFAAVADAGALLLPVCTACGNAHWYPRRFCPACESTRLEWRQASGRGTIYSFSIMRRAEPPFALAYVQLEEGPMMLTNLVADDLDGLDIGQPVELTFRLSGTDRLPVFQPVNAKQTP